MATKKNLTTTDISGVRNGGGSANYYLGDRTNTQNATAVHGGKGKDLLAPTQNGTTLKNYGGVLGSSSASEMASSDAARQSNLESNSLYALMKRLNAESEPAAEDPYKDGGNGGGRSVGYYDPSSDLMAAYNARQAALKNNYDAALNQRRQAYETAVGDLRNQGDEALREAYINMMMNMRGLNQSLEAAGLRGGASESARAGLYNRYASDRNAISRAIAQQLANAGNEYGNDITELGLKYNQNGADAMSDYQNQIIKARQSLANQLAKTGSNANGITTDAGALWDGTPGVNVQYGNLADILATQNATPTNVVAAQTANNLPDYTTPGNTVARLRAMAPRDAYEYVMSMPTDDGTKLSILQAAFTRDELNEMANMF